MLLCKINIKRAERRISQKELSLATGIRLPTISDMEMNKSKSISVENIVKLCDYFDCDICDLWQYTPNKKGD